MMEKRLQLSVDKKQTATAGCLSRRSEDVIIEADHYRRKELWRQKMF